MVVKTKVPKLQTGDIFITDSPKTGAKIVQFLATAPTIWHHLYWKLFNKKKLESMRPAGYHYGMVLDEETMIEQQGKVQIRGIDKIFRKECYIYRKKNLTENARNALQVRAVADLGEGYGVLECFGKLFTWLTGIKLFARYMDLPDNAICVVRVGEWYALLGETFGVKHPNYLTARLQERYLDPSNDWELIFMKLK